VADHTVISLGIRFIRLCKDLLHHFGFVVSDMLDPLMAFQAVVFSPGKQQKCQQGH
jgi:hypothetical protein